MVMEFLDWLPLMQQDELVLLLLAWLLLLCAACLILAQAFIHEPVCWIVLERTPGHWEATRGSMARIHPDTLALHVISQPSPHHQHRTEHESIDHLLVINLMNGQLFCCLPWPLSRERLKW
jgi:hypothetical protein